MDDVQSPFVARRDPVKTELTTDLIKRLHLERRPVGVDSKGKLIFEANPSSAPFFVWDASRTAPPGFGVKSPLSVSWMPEEPTFPWRIVQCKPGAWQELLRAVARR